MNEDIQLFKANEVLQYKYISVPKELFVNPKYSHLSSDSKLLYGFILDRFTLSIKNNWQDENGNVYLIFTRKDIQKSFHSSDKT
ncbi:MAG: replication initiator protein A [Clostridia bacterium]|nr:replication initiator protein A [Clostridia bacterium]